MERSHYSSKIVKIVPKAVNYLHFIYSTSTSEEEEGDEAGAEDDTDVVPPTPERYVHVADLNSFYMQCIAVSLLKVLCILNLLSFYSSPDTSPAPR